MQHGWISMHSVQGWMPHTTSFFATLALAKWQGKKSKEKYKRKHDNEDNENLGHDGDVPHHNYGVVTRLCTLKKKTSFCGILILLG